MSNDFQRPHKLTAQDFPSCTVPASDSAVCATANAADVGDLPAYIEPYIGIKTPPRIYENSTTEGEYMGPRFNVRPGADDHLQHKSHGVRA